MSSIKQSTTAKKPSPTLAEVFERVLTSYDYDDTTGPFTISVTADPEARCPHTPSGNELLPVCWQTC